MKINSVCAGLLCLMIGSITSASDSSSSERESQSPDISGLNMLVPDRSSSTVIDELPRSSLEIPVERLGVSPSGLLHAFAQQRARTKAQSQTVEQPEQWWTAPGRNYCGGVRIEIFLQATSTANAAGLGAVFAARQIPWRLALQLEPEMSADKAESIVWKTLHTYEEELSLKDECVRQGWQVKRMLLKVSLLLSNVKLLCVGEADPATFSTFFPPCTIRDISTTNS